MTCTTYSFELSRIGNLTHNVAYTMDLGTLNNSLNVIEKIATFVETLLSFENIIILIHDSNT